MSLTRLAACAAALALALAARPAHALGREIGLGADWLVDDDAGAGLLTLAFDGRVDRNVTVGARAGVGLASNPSRLVLPADARLRVRIQRAYLEGLAGPWLVTHDHHGGEAGLRLHAALGGGVYLSRGVSLGLEVGYLDPTGTVGVRMAFAF